MLVVDIQRKKAVVSKKEHEKLEKHQGLREELIGTPGAVTPKLGE